MLVYNYKLRFFVNFCLASSSSLTFFNSLLSSEVNKVNKIKSYFITLYSMGAMIAALHAGVMLFVTDFNNAWIGAFISIAPIAIFFTIILTQKNMARTSTYLPQLVVPSLLGFGLALGTDQPSIMPIAYTLGLGIVGTLLYVFWYSEIDRSAANIKVGDTLPDFTLYSSKGGEVPSSAIRAQPSLLLFFRGNWCPLCMAQIKEIAASYQELDKRGVKVFLVSPQSEKQSQSLAQQFDAPMEFMVDKDLSVAKQLGILHKSGTPFGMMAYDNDTVMPTAILTDASGKIIFADLTDNYRVRPEPQTFLDMLDKHGVSA